MRWPVTPGSCVPPAVFLVQPGVDVATSERQTGPGTHGVTRAGIVVCSAGPPQVICSDDDADYERADLARSWTIASA